MFATPSPAPESDGGEAADLLFDRVLPRQGGDSLKWSAYPPDVLPLWVADMDFAAPPPVIDALQRRVAEGVFGYGVPWPGMVEAILNHLQQTYGWTVRPEWLVWLPGLVSGLNAACRAVGQEGAGVFTATPIYPPFLSAPVFAGRRCLTAALAEEEGRAREAPRWTWDWAAVEQALAEGARVGHGAAAFLLCHPHNPVGRVWSRDDLVAVGECCRRHNLVLISDEIHCDLVLEPGLRHIPAAVACPELAEHSITLMAPSKTFNIPGLGASFAIVPGEPLRRALNRATRGILPHTNVLGLHALEAAYREGWPWVAALRRYLGRNRDRVWTALSALPGLRVNRPEATYLAWIDARETGWTDPAARFLAGGVALSDGRDFGAPGFVRLNFGCPRAVLEEALQRLARTVGEGVTGSP